MSYDSTEDLVALKQVLAHSDFRTLLRHVNHSQPRMDKVKILFRAQNQIFNAES